MSAIDSDKVDPHLGGVPETLLIPLWARALEQKHANPLLVDPHATRITESLDYDFQQFARQRVETENFCVRGRIVDEVVRGILRRAPDRPVIEFGPGLDSRFYRIGQKAPWWMEVDLPEVMELRREFYPSHSQRVLSSASMLDDGWINACREYSAPPVFVAEGVFYFFSKQQIQSLLNTIRTRFPGASLVFDAVSPLYLKLANLRHPLSDSRMQFSLSPGAAELNLWNASWSVDSYVGYGDSPWYDAVMHRFAWWKRTAVRLLPVARHAFMIVHAECSDRSSHPSPHSIPQAAINDGSSS